MRASWFRHVDEVYGRDVILEVMYTKEGFAPEVVEAALGRTLDEVDAGWRAWAGPPEVDQPDLPVADRCCSRNETGSVATGNFVGAGPEE